MPPFFIDTHCHLTAPPFSGDETQTLAAAAAAGVKKIIAVSVDVRDACRVIDLAREYPVIYPALGVHPMASETGTEHIALLENHLQQQRDRVVAIGEIGLDTFISSPAFDLQLPVFLAQLALAKKYDLPVILHSRRTHDQLIKYLRRYRLPRRGVIHGFSGSEQQALAFIREGYALGVGGTITWPRAMKTRRVFARVPLHALLLESDAPYMPLQGYQGQANRPERIQQTWQCLCELRPESPQTIAEALLENSHRYFNLA
ncbi:MAG: putative metal-dependent hydrolase YjjV [Candidatus Erwinia impunctatus]|nr:putative metal-dependent hydrolase YjjV [Culicoides impunctatus]